jgi:DNA repair photolyase
VILVKTNAAEVLEIFKRFKNPVVLSTKSALVTRDLDLLEELAKITFVNVMFTVTTVNEALKKKIEPRVQPVERRLDAIRQLSKAKVPVGVLLAPILPGLTDTEKEIESVVEAVAEAGADFLIPDVLNLTRSARPKYMSFLREEFPALLPSYETIYSSDYPAKEYARGIRKIASRLAKKYGVDKFEKMRFTVSPG